MNQVGAILVIVSIVLCGCRRAAVDRTPQQNDAELIVAAAVSLKESFEEIGRLYTANTGNPVKFSFGASGTLQRQIEAGAPMDVFASAGATQMDELESGGLIMPESRRNFAENDLVLITPADSKLEINGFASLTQTAVTRIAIGNPKTVPAGQYTEQVLTRSGTADELRAKLITAEDARQVLDYVARDEVDAGVVYATDARIGGDKIRVAAVASNGSHDPILYPIAIVKDGSNSEAARKFVEFVLSSEGQNILRRHGFSPASH
jgi:molybdate transport system substrate-binding protein